MEQRRTWMTAVSLVTRFVSSTWYFSRISPPLQLPTQGQIGVAKLGAASLERPSRAAYRPGAAGPVGSEAEGRDECAWPAVQRAFLRLWLIRRPKKKHRRQAA